MIFQKTKVIPNIDLLSWLNAQQRFPKFYFKDSDREIVACGNLLHFDHFPDTRKLPEEIKIFGFRTATHLRDTFFVPTLQIEKKDSRTRFSQNFISKQSNLIEPNINFSIINTSPIQAQFIHCTPNYPEWEKLFSLYHNTKALEKVVLSRKLRYKMKEFYSLYSIMKLLEKYTENSHLYLFEQRPQFGYVGASPELLYEKSNQNISVDALASTRKKSFDPEKNKILQKDLFESTKDQNEFLYVLDYIKKVCQPFCENIQTTKSSVLQTQDVLHLYAQLQAKLYENASESSLFAALHPTPAIAGFPKNKALKFIEEHEFPRSFYSSSYGWASKNDSKFIVAIRGAKVEGKALELQSGVGIVKESDPQKEWQELNDKLYCFQNKIMEIT